MLTYSPHEKLAPRPDEKPWLLLALVFVWQCPGVIAHDLWRTEMLDFARVMAINPLEIFGEPSITHIPLFARMGSIMRSALSPWAMDSYTAVRLVTAFWMALAFTAIGVAARNLLGKYNGRSVVMILIGCPGIMIFGHMMGSLPILFCAICLFWCAIALAQRTALLSGILMGLGAILAFSVENLSALVFLLFISLMLLFHPHWRNARYAMVLLIAWSIALPLAFLWGLVLYQNHPDFFTLWWNRSALGLFGGFDRFVWEFTAFERLFNLIWYALPALLLTLWSLSRKTLWYKPVGFAGGVWLLAAFIMISFSAENNDALLWLLTPLALWGALHLDDMKKSVTSFLNWCSATVFGALGIMLWGLFIAMYYHRSPWIQDFMHSLGTPVAPHWNYFPLILAIVFSILWLFALTRRHIRGRQAVTNWAMGMTLVWTIMLGLFAPWLDELKSYRPAVYKIESQFSEEQRMSIASHAECLDSNNLVLLASWKEFGALPIQKRNAQKPCSLSVQFVSPDLPASSIWGETVNINASRNKIVLVQNKTVH